MPAKQLTPNKEPQYDEMESYHVVTNFTLDTQIRFDQRMIYNHPERYDAAQMSAMQDLCIMGCTNDALKQMADSGLSGEKMQAIADGMLPLDGASGGFFERLFNKVDNTEMYQDLLQRAADPETVPRTVHRMADIYTDPELISAQKSICTQRGLDWRQMTVLRQLQNPKTGEPLSVAAAKQLADSKVDALSMEVVGNAARSNVIPENEIPEFVKAAKNMQPAAVSVLIEMSQNTDLAITDIDKMIEANADKMEIAYISRNCHSSTEVDIAMQNYNEEDALGIKKSQYTDEQWDALKNVYTILQNPNDKSAKPLTNEQMDVLKDPSLSANQIDHLARRGRTSMNPDGTARAVISADDMKFLIDLDKQINPEHNRAKESALIETSADWIEAGVPKDQIELMAENIDEYGMAGSEYVGKLIAELDASDVCTKEEVDAMVVNMTKNDGFRWNPSEPSIEALEHMSSEMKTQIVGIYEHGSYADMHNVTSALQSLDRSESAKSMSAEQWDHVIQKTLDDGPDNPRNIDKDIKQETRAKTPAQAIRRAIDAAKSAPRTESKEAGIDTKDMGAEDENAGHKGFGE